MTNITLTSLAPQLTDRLQQRALQNGRTAEAEIAVILPEPDQEANLDLVTAIEQRFSSLEGFDLPKVPREPIKTPPLV